MPPRCVGISLQHDAAGTSIERWNNGRWRDNALPTAILRRRACIAREQQELRSYDRIMKDDAMVSNREIASKYASVEDAEDDFM